MQITRALSEHPELFLQEGAMIRNNWLCLPDGTPTILLAKSRSAFVRRGIIR